MKMPLIIGHRGCKYPGVRENSCDAVEQSLKEGVDIIELDVLRLKDGSFAGHHPYLLRKTPGGSVDSLENLLKTLNSKAVLYADIKDNPSAKEMDMLFEIIKKYHKNQVIIGSFYEAVLRHFRGIAPGWVINYHCLPILPSIKKAKEIGADWVNPIPYAVSKNFVAEVLNQGMKFVPAGNENYNKQLHYIKLGAHAISVFKPAVFKEWLKNRL